MSKREWCYTIAVFVVAAIAATTFAIWTVYGHPGRLGGGEPPSGYSWTINPKGATIDDNHNRP